MRDYRHRANISKANRLVLTKYALVFTTRSMRHPDHSPSPLLPRERGQVKLETCPQAEYRRYLATFDRRVLRAWCVTSTIILQET